MPPRRRHRQRPAAPRADLQRQTTARVTASTPVRLTREQDGVDLAAELSHPARERPVVVVSVPAGRRAPWIDADAVAEAVLGLAEVVVLATDAASWALAEIVPPGGQVYGGAGRAYPPGLGWMTELTQAPIRFACSEQDAQRATEMLIHDALGMVAKAGGSRPAGRRGIDLTGVVKVLVPPSRALVELEDGGLATVWQELTVPSVPIDRLLQEGQSVRGFWDAESKRLDIMGMRLNGPAWALGLGRGDVVLTRVVEVRPDVVLLALHPDVVVPVVKERVTTRAEDTLTSLFSEGEVVLARVAARDDDRVFLRLDDVDDGDEPVPAPALVSGGPPWLVPPTPERSDDEAALVAEPAAAEDPSAGAATGGGGAGAEGGRAGGPDLTVARSGRQDPSQGRAGGQGARRRPASAPVPAGRVRDLELEVHRLRSERDAADRAAAAFTARSRELEERNAWLERKVRHQRTVLRQEKLRDRRASPTRQDREVATTEESRAAFDDPVRQFRHEVYLAWADLIPAGEKGEHPLPPYSLGPDFLRSLDVVHGVDRTKVVRVVVEVLTGLAERLDGRDLHVLRSGAGAGAAPVMRTDGATGWRVALQRETPAARRLHFWRGVDTVELARVVTHDDMRI